MKKITLFLLATLLVSAAGWAQKPLSQERMKALVAQPTATAKKGVPQKNLQHQVDLNRLTAARAALADKSQHQLLKKTDAAKSASPLRVQRAITGDESYIVDQPAGRQQYYKRSGSAYYVMSFWVVNTTFSGAVGNVVFGENNEVYIKNLISQYACNSWVKGTLNGSTITIDFPQKAMEQTGTEFYYQLVSYSAEDQWYNPAEEVKSITLDYDPATGAITTPAGSPLQYGEIMIGLTGNYDDGESWVGYGDWDINMTEMNEEPVKAPEGLSTSTYSISGEGVESHIAQVGFDGDDVWVQGLYNGMPEAWVKGTISGDKVTFKSGQFMGADESIGYYQYLVSATAETLWDDYYEEWYTEYSLSDTDITFDYDAATKTLSNSSTFLVNAGTEEVYYAAAYDKAKIAPFIETAAIPAAPIFNSIYEGGYEYYEYGYGWGYLDFDVICADVDGNFIIPEKVSYQIYTKTNGEVHPYVLDADDYLYLDESMTEVPYNFTDKYDIYVNGANRNIYFFVIGPEEFGVQTIYRGGGEERRSEIVWMGVQEMGAETQPDAATPEYPDIDPSDVGGSIDYGYYIGEENIVVFGEAKAETYDVAVKLQNPALTGTHIESITFPVQDLTGVSGISAWISSQLRVEDNKNVPDLACVSVVPTEPGFVTVKLDKPYIIPAEGVYVGYTLTIDEVSNEESAYPLALVDVQHEDGFWLHTSKSFLKWMDHSEYFGVSALIQVTVSGSKVKENAVAPKDGSQQYVMTGSEIEIPVQLENHGSAGIKSFDVEYTIAGASGVQHFDLSTPVDGFFGKVYTAIIKLPAIAEKGNYELALNVTKVNGVDNGDVDPQSVTPIVALNTIPKHKALIEEYTGTWCGYCPRGLVALETLAEVYPNDYVRISYHNGDPMEILDTYSFPNDIAGYPDAWIDRIIEVDPYYGSGNGDMDVLKDLQARNKEFGHGSIEFTANWGTDGTTVDVETDVTFAYDVKGNKFAIEYVLVADGLSGEGSDWEQSNYYSGGSYGPMGGFENMDSYVPGVVFNDVAIMTSNIGGITGSLPATIEADKVMSHQYTFYLEDALNTAYQPIIVDKTKTTLRVVGLIINRETGEVVNANAAVVGQSTAISEVSGAKGQVTGVQFYDLGGRRLNAAQHGVNIMKISYADGTEKTVKVFK